MLNKVGIFLKGIGAEVYEAKLPEIDGVFEMWMSLIEDDYPITYEMTNRKYHENLYIELLKALIGRSKYTAPTLMISFYKSKIMPLFPSLKENSHHIKRRDSLKNAINKLLGDDGVLLLPTIPTIRVKPSSTYLQFKNASYTGLFNCLNMTMTQIPMGLAKNGSPLGFQAVTTNLNDRFTIKLAEVIEEQFGGWVSPSLVQV